MFYIWTLILFKTTASGVSEIQAHMIVISNSYTTSYSHLNRMQSKKNEMLILKLSV